MIFTVSYFRKALFIRKFFSFRDTLERVIYEFSAGISYSYDPAAAAKDFGVSDNGRGMFAEYAVSVAFGFFVFPHSIAPFDFIILAVAIISYFSAACNYFSHKKHGGDDKTENYYQHSAFFRCVAF